MVRPGRERLSGAVEADETFLGGPEPGRPGRGALGKTLVEVAVEQDGDCLGRCRIEIIPDGTARTLRTFLLANVEPGSTVLTDGFASYPSACGEDYRHRREPIATSEHRAHELLPGVHRVASLAKQWLLGTHQARVAAAHLQAYLDEFTFRFNRRHSRARDMLFYRLLEQAVQATPRTYRSLVADPGSRGQTLPVPPLTKRVHCDSLASEALDRPQAPRSDRGTGEVTLALLHLDGNPLYRILTHDQTATPLRPARVQLSGSRGYLSSVACGQRAHCSDEEQRRDRRQPTRLGGRVRKPRV